MGYRVGERAGPYEVLQLLGRGTFGEVLLAQDVHRPQHRVALKTVSCDQLTGESADRVRLAALREAQLLGRLRHPHIVRCEEVQWDVDRRVVWLALEYMEGGDLFDRLMELGRLPEYMVAAVTKQVAGALRYVHGKGIAHRDLKLENICFCSRESWSTDVKVIDWGLGKYFALGPMRSNVGTDTYSAPEVMGSCGKKKSKGYTSACDLWSLGIVVHATLCGRPPFSGSLMEQHRRMREESFSLEGEFWDRVSPGPKDLIRQLLKFSPEKRLTAAQVLEHPWLIQQQQECIPVDRQVVANVLSNIEQFSRTPDFFSLCVASVARQLDHVSLRGIHEVFCQLDINGDGYLDINEVKNGFMQTFGESSGFVQDIDEIFQHIDLDATGLITYTEFCAAGLGDKSYQDEHVLWAAFKQFDFGDDGFITTAEMQKVFSDANVNQVWSESVCKEVVKEVMEEFGCENGTINFETWLKIMRSCAIREQEAPRLSSSSSVISRSADFLHRVSFGMTTPASANDDETPTKVMRDNLYSLESKNGSVPASPAQRPKVQAEPTHCFEGLQRCNCAVM
mmetsp:Transcript_6221/g.16602  ORF Transcript_6221/g.16602 Transcript_6221/m.16602 type:complete len:565 (+) Transcript_6221:103-1797(+)